MNTSLAVKKTFKKPKNSIVKDFFDLDESIHKYLNGRLPFISTAKMKISQIYRSKDQIEHRYRVNWIDLDSGLIVKSLYVVLTTNASGNIKTYNEA